MRIKSFKGRDLNTTLKVRVHRNLHKQMWSVSQGGRVVAHATYIAVSNCKFIVYKAGWKRMIRTGQRNVHAFVEGYVLPFKPRGPFYDARYDRALGAFQMGRAFARLTHAGVAVFGPDGLKVKEVMLA